MGHPSLVLFLFSPIDLPQPHWVLSTLDCSNSGHTTSKSPTTIDQLVCSKAQCECNSAVPDIKHPKTTQDNQHPTYATTAVTGACIPQTSHSAPACPTGEGAHTCECPLLVVLLPLDCQGQHTTGQATPCWWEKKKDTRNGEDIDKCLQAIQTDADLT